MHKEEMKVKALKEFDYNQELYHMVDFLNKSLKDKNLIFGMRKSGDKAVITIYEAE